MPKKSFLTAAMSLSAIVFVTACGSSSSTPESQIKSTFDGVVSAFASGDGAKACGALTPAAQEALVTLLSPETGASDCQTGVAKLSKARKALSAGDWKTFCESVDSKIAAQIASDGPALNVPANCEAVGAVLNSDAAGKAMLKDIQKGVDESFGHFGTAKIAEIKVTGDTATGMSTSKFGQSPTTFEKVNGSWKIAS